MMMAEKSVISEYGIGGRWIGPTKNSIHLSTEHDAFAEVDDGQSEEFEFSLSTFFPDDVLTISVFCVSLGGSEFSVDNRKKVIGVDFSPLLFDLYYISPYPSASSTTSNMYNLEDDDRGRERIPLQPRLLNGQYCITLCASHGIRKGSYILSIHLDPSKRNKVAANSDNRLRAQTIRLQRRICPIVRAIPLEQGAVFVGQVSDTPMSHFRFISHDPSKAITIAIQSSSHTNTKRRNGDDLTWMNTENDIEIYVTNKGDGLVGVTRDDYVWRAVASATARIDILPGDVNNDFGGGDEDDGADNDAVIYMIGVSGSNNGVQYELTVRETYPDKISSLLLTDIVQYDQSVDVKKPSLEPQPRSSYHLKHDRIEPGKYQYYSIPITSAGARVGDDIVVVVSCNKDISDLHGTRLVQRMGKKENLESRYEVSTTCGRAVFTADTFSIYGAQGPAMGRAPVSRNESASNLHSNSPSRANCAHEEVKDSSYTGTLFPIVYISQTCKYPTAEDYAWRASGWDGTAVFFVDQREFSQMGLDTCYFSVFGFDISQTSFKPPEDIDDLVKTWPKTVSNIEGTSAVAATVPKAESKCVLYLHTDSLLYRCSPDDFARYSIFEDLFSDVNGHLLSQKDRETSMMSLWEDEQMFAYSEVDFMSFQDILQQAGAVDGQIFYDLGAGCGKAVVAAALSNRVRFLKTVGIELLPSLCFCASAVVSAISSQAAAAPASNNLSYIHSSNRSATFAPSPRGAMGNTLISSGNGRDNRMNNNVFLKSFKSAVLKTLQKSFVSEDSHVNDSYIQSGADLQDDAKDSVKSYVLENKGGGAGPNFAYAEADRASEAPIAMNVSSIHSEQSITSAHYVNTGKEAESTSLLLAPAKNSNQLLLSGKIVEDAIKSATSLFSIPKAITSRVQAAKLRLPITEIRFGDVIDGEMDWSDGDFIFLSGYSFPDDLLSAVFDRARALKMGSKVVTLSLPEDKDKLYRNFDLVKSFSAKMSWGKVTVYVLVRKNNRALLFTEVPYFAADEYGAMEANST